jgi:ABC-type transport system substrate-binding protein
VLLGIAAAAISQTGSGEPSATAIDGANQPETDAVVTSPPTKQTSTVPNAIDYRIGLLAGLTTTNFWKYMGEEPTVWNTYVLGPTKPALFGIDPASNSLSPDLAGSEAPDPVWDASGWRVEVDLTGALSWSDGSPVAAKDIAYTFQTVRRLGLDGGWAEGYPADIEEVIAESPTRIRIEFVRRPSLEVWPYGIGLAPIMPEHAWEPVTALADSAASLYEHPSSIDLSGGPLSIKTVDEDRIVSVANPGYRGAAPDSVTYLVFGDEEAAVTALAKGGVDTILSPNGLSNASLNDLQSQPGVAIEKSPANSVRYVGFNLTREPMSDPAFRQAVALLLDREAATESFAPDASAAYTVLTAANETWFDQKQAEAIAEPYAGGLGGRLNLAVAALESAGYAWSTAPSLEDERVVAGTGLTIHGRPAAPLTILTPGDEYDPVRSDYTKRIEATVELLGFDARAVVTDFDTVVDLAFGSDEKGARQYDLYVLGWTLGNPALPDYYRWLFASDGDANSTGYASVAFDSALARYEEATEEEAAQSALWTMERLIAADLPYLVLYHPEIVEAYRSDRIGFQSHGVLGGIQGRLGGITDLVSASSDGS